MASDLIFAGMIFVALVLVGRAITLWYFRINHAIALLEDIAESLRTLPAVRRYDQVEGRRPPRAA
jgi:hypothetical protein